MSIRDIRQQELATKWIKSGECGIINAAPRMGKIKTSIFILQEKKYEKVLIAYPDVKIKLSWKSDFKKWVYDDRNVTYITHMSLKKHVDEKYDLIILDEIHLLSASQVENVKLLQKNNNKFLGLTGTLSSETRKWLVTNLYLPVVATYSIAQAIEEGVIADYEISIIKVALDNARLNNYKGKLRTEKKQFDNLTWVINKLEADNKSTFFVRLTRMRIIQNSESKRLATGNLILKNIDKRILIFCGVTDIADNLDIPSYHSKSTEKKIFEDFVTGVGNHLAVCKIGNTGTTYIPLNYVIINYFDSNSQNLTQKLNRCMSYEYDNPDKKAHIYIISSDEEVELRWLEKALTMFETSKIKYL